MPLQLLNCRLTTSNNWGVVGAPTPYEAVVKGSTDASYVGTTTVGNRCDLFCGDGRKPLGGFVGALLVTCRLRRQSVSTGGSVDLFVNQNSTDRLVANLTPPPSVTTWQDYTFRVRIDWTSSLRFTDTDLNSLGLAVELNSAPSVDGFDVSLLYMEVEQVDSIMYYDPFVGVTPDAIVGPRAATSTVGTQPASIVGNYLNIADASAVDSRSYIFENTAVDVYDQKWTTVTECVVRVNSAAVPTPTNLVYFITLDTDKDQGTLLGFVISNGSRYLGILHSGGSESDPTAYQALIPFDWLGSTHHYRFVVDRSVDPDDRGLVQVFVDHNPTPIFELPYDEFPDPFNPPLTAIAFGTTTDATADVDIDYYSWWYEQRFPYLAQAWLNETFSTNEIIRDNQDPEISKLIELPPGVTAGESDVAMKLTLNDESYPCQLLTRFDDEVGATLYDLSIDYKTSNVSALQVRCQRMSDLYYWDQGTTSWVATLAQVSPVVALTRTQLQIFTGITNASPEQLVFTFALDTGGAPPPSLPEAWLYKAVLTK